MPTLAHRRVLCPFVRCPANHGLKAHHVIAHSSLRTRHGTRKRRLCKVCKRTFSATTETVYARLRRSRSVVDSAVQMQAEGMTKAAISRVVGASASTISRWLAKAAAHARIYHEVNTHPTDAAEVQMDELALSSLPLD